MAVGGMVGGGIFSTLGVVISIAGAWTWLSFLAAGLVAFCTAYAYAKLAEDAGEAGRPSPSYPVETTTPLCLGRRRISPSSDQPPQGIRLEASAAFPIWEIAVTAASS
jgi:hypothetical protein